ncbi:DUF397 domain-containing protein [Kitasatospora sp. MAA19]|uniref:DUF397 domain-containing protein n=1 Tax=Kitasatospora sp. MAA19 TaxID=3035090 RepID=UPI0032AED7FF
MNWSKATASNPNENCVECGQLENRMAVRDSKDPHGPALGFSPEAWQSFVVGVQAGEFPAAP